MAVEQRKMVSTHVHEREIPEVPKQQPNIQKSRKYFSVGEKFLFVLFSIVLVAFSSMIIHTEGQINNMNREVQGLDTTINNTTKQNTELSIQVREKSTYEKVWETAKDRGLNLNEKNVKVVPGR